MIKSTEKLAVNCKFFRAFWYNLIRSKSLHNIYYEKNDHSKALFLYTFTKDRDSVFNKTTAPDNAATIKPNIFKLCGGENFYF